MKALLIICTFLTFSVQAQKTLFDELLPTQPEEIKGGSSITNAQRAYERYKKDAAGMAEYQECLRRSDEIPKHWAPNFGDKLVFFGENSVRTFTFVDGEKKVASALIRIDGGWEPAEVILSSIKDGKEKFLGWNLYQSDFILMKNHSLPLVKRKTDKEPD